MGKCWKCGKECARNPGRRSSKYFCSDKCYLMNRTEKTDTCWLSKTCIRKDGYSALQKDKKEILAHRLSYQIFKGELLDEKLVCHTCDVRNCVNPDHLYLGDHSDNAYDRQERNKKCSQVGFKNHRAKLTEQHILDIRKMYEKGYKKATLAKYFDIYPSHIGNIVNKKRWGHL